MEFGLDRMEFRLERILERAEVIVPSIYVMVIINNNNNTHNSILADREKLMKNSIFFNKALDDDNEYAVELPVHDFCNERTFNNFVRFMDLDYVKPPKPLPSSMPHFTPQNLGNIDNVNFINTFFEPSEIDSNNLPTELINSLLLANFLGATQFLEWCVAKCGSIVKEKNLIKL
jgi:hypothetical protein